MSHLILKLILIAIISGQLIKIPIGGLGGPTLLDIVVLFLCGYFLIKNKFKLPKPSIIIKSTFPFILIAITSLIFSPLHLSNAERLTSFFYLIRFASFILLGWLIKDKPKNILEKSGIILAILGLLQLIFIPDLGFLANQGWDPHFFRTAGTFLDPNFLGAFLILTLLIIFSLKSKSQNILFILVYIALLTTFSRGAYLGFLIAFLTYSLTQKSIKLALISLLLFSGLMIGFFGYTKLVAAPRGVDRTKSAELRLGTWQQGFEILQKNPILGVGFNAYRYGLREYNLADEQFLNSHGATSNDSSLLFVLSTTGILGFLAYLYWLGNLAWAGWKKNPILLAGLLGLLAQSFFANTLFYPPLLLWLVLI